MKLLDKYHKQKIDKATIKRFSEYTSRYALSYDLKNDYDLLRLSVFETGLKNKQTFEKQFELIRNQNIDMWENLSFNERNFLIKCDIAPEKAKLRKFTFEEQNIYIPFFDRLLNNLYDQETAILELPQYFKLYDQFADRIQTVDRYGFAPYIANMAMARCVLKTEEQLVLFDKDRALFYVLTHSTCLRYPILEGKIIEEDKLKELAEALLVNEDAFVDALIKYELIHAKCIKKIEKYRSKGKAL